MKGPSGPRPRVLVLSPDFPPARGGIQLLVHRVAANLRELSPLIVTRAAREAAGGVDGQLRVRRLKLLRRFPKAALPLLNLKAVGVGLRFRPDVVLNAHVITGPGAVAVSTALRVPLVQYLHADEVPGRPWLSRFVLRRSAAVVAVSRHTADMAAALDAPSTRIHLIPPGVDLPEPSSPRGSRDRPTIVTVARLEDRYKGHDVVIQALPAILEQVPEARWIVVGEGSLRPELERRVAESGVRDAVEFAGAVDDPTRNALLDSAAVFLMPSRLPDGGTGGEGFGIAYMEAAARELPAVAGNVAGARDAVVDGQTGLLVDPTDPDAVARAVTSLLLDPARARKLGAAAAARALDFSWPRIACQVERLLLEQIGSDRA